MTYLFRRRPASRDAHLRRTCVQTAMRCTTSCLPRSSPLPGMSSKRRYSSRVNRALERRPHIRKRPRGYLSPPTGGIMPNAHAQGRLSLMDNETIVRRPPRILHYFSYFACLYYSVLYPLHPGIASHTHIPSHPIPHHSRHILHPARNCIVA